MAQKPSIPKGTRDFTPVEMLRRNYIFDTIKSVFKLYGYAPIETPEIIISPDMIRPDFTTTFFYVYADIVDDETGRESFPF